MSNVLYNKSVPGRKGFTLPASGKREGKHKSLIPQKYLRKEQADLPQASELDVVRHFTNLSKMNFGVDSHFYPLGSCTMKYNPKINEKIASFEGFSNLHPLLPQLKHGGMLTQGALEVLYETQTILCEITGMEAFTLQPLAGAHGELTGIMLIAAYHKDKGNTKTKVLIPDSGHGTNPATAAIAGYDVVSIPTGSDGCMDMEAYKQAMDHETAGVMLTCPNTLGLFNTNIREVTRIAHEHDALLYYDGANLNALLGKTRIIDLGFDVVHINLHKTFSTPHGGGGPGAGPVGVNSKLVPYLPTSIVSKRTDGTFSLTYDRPKSIGYIAPFYGNFLVILRAYAYMLMLGKEGLSKVSEHAVLNANYLQARLKKILKLPYDRSCMHECVFTAETTDGIKLKAQDIAKALLDKNIHPPTVYFPLIIKEALMIEPTETESMEAIDSFIDAMKEIIDTAKESPESLHEVPFKQPIRRPDEVQAARKMDIMFPSS